LVDFHKIWLGGDAIQGDLDAIILIHSFSVLKWLRFKFKIFSLAQQCVGHRGMYFTKASEIKLNNWNEMKFILIWIKLS
jgi:hypothetical protein